MTGIVIVGCVLLAMAAIAVDDARRAMVDPRLVLLLLVAAAGWRFAEVGEDGAWARLADGVLGAALGLACVVGPIVVAFRCGRRWPLYPGDAMMLGALGFLLGPLGLAWTMVIGAIFGLVYRFWLQRRRGRPFSKGLVPLGPGMCAGAAVVFLLLDCGVALAGDGAEPNRQSPAAALPATELAPPLTALPPGLASREVVVEGHESLPFPDTVRRLSSLSGVAMRIEERPSRIAGGAAVLDDPPPLALSWNGPLAGLLDRVAALSGYGWSWQARVPGTRVPEALVPWDGAVVFHRYWDVEQRGPEAAATDGDENAAGADGRWTVDPARHRTLRGVLGSWAARAGWTLVWNAGRDYALGAPATFEGGFLDAADLLLSGPATRRTLAVRAYTANRHLVVGDAGGADR